MGEAPAFQFYARDFLVSTTRMTTAQVGLYMRALSNQWDSGPLPADEQELARTLISPLAEFRKLWPVVSKKFILTDAGYINRRLEREREKQEAFRLKLSEKGKRGAGKRWAGHTTANAQAMPQPSPSQCPDDASSSAVCDLQSAEKEREDPPLAHRSYGMAGNRRTNLLSNNLEHSQCGYAPACTVGVCVLHKQHAEFTRRLAVSDGLGPDARSLQDFYADTVAEWRASKKVPGGSCWQAWGTRFEAWLGVEAKPAQRSGKETISERAIRSHTEFMATLPPDRPERPSLAPPRPTRPIASGE